LLLLVVWHAPLAVCSAIRRHEPPQRTVLSQVDCVIQCEVVSCKTLLDDVKPGRPGGLLQFSGGGAVRIISASASSSIRAMCSNKERRCDWRIGCLVASSAHRCEQIGAIRVRAVLSNTTHQDHHSGCHPPCWLPSIQIHSERLVGCNTAVTTVTYR